MYETKRDDILEDFRRYLKIEEGLSEKTIDEHETMVAVYLDEQQTVHPDQQTAKQFQEDLMDDDYSHSHINNTMKAIEYYYEFLDKEFGWTRLERPKQLPEVLSQNQVRQILYACDTYRDYAIIKTLASSGVRASELCDLDVNDIDLDDRTLHIQQGKFDKEGIAQISESCTEAIEKYLKRRESQSEPLFLSRSDNRLTRSGLLQLVKRRAREAGIEQTVNVHMFRHYFATSMIENGADVSVVKDLMRHEDIASTMKYLHLSGEALAEQYDRYVDDI